MTNHPFLLIAAALCIAWPAWAADPAPPEPAKPAGENQDWTEGVAEAEALNAEVARERQADAAADAQRTAQHNAQVDAARVRAAQYGADLATHAARVAQMEQEAAEQQRAYEAAQAAWQARVDACRRGVRSQCATPEERAQMRAAERAATGAN